MAPKSVTFRRHDHLVSVLFGDLLSHSYNITFSYLVSIKALLERMYSGFVHLIDLTDESPEQHVPVTNESDLEDLPIGPIH